MSQVTAAALIVLFCVSACAIAQEATEIPVSSLSFALAGVYGDTATFQVALGDLDSDGDLDAVFSNMGVASEIWLNDGLGQFTNSGQYLGAYGHGVGIGDLDADGDLDLQFAQATSSYSSQTYINNGSGRVTFSRNTLQDRDQAANFIELFDVEGDGDLDAGVYYSARYNILYLNDGTGAFAAADPSIPGMASWGDLDGDGDVDAIAQQHNGGYIVYRNLGDASFEASDSFDAPTSFFPGGAMLGDLDNDGDLDLVVGSGYTPSSPLPVLLNDGSGAFTYTPSPAFRIDFGRVSLADFNNDGFLDVFIGCLDAPSLIGLNDGTGHFTDSTLRIGTNSMAGPCAMGDLDGDGDVDIFMATYGEGGPNEVWLNETTNN